MGLPQLSARHKRWFFSQLDELQKPCRHVAASASGSAESANAGAGAGGHNVVDAAQRHGEENVAGTRRQRPNPSTSGEKSKALATKHSAELKAGSRETSGTAIAKLDDSLLPEKRSTSPSMRRAVHTTAKKKRKKSGNAIPGEEAQLLCDQRVLLVPIGLDVSRKRLAIWQDMVQTLGGSVVQYSENKCTKVLTGSSASGQASVDWKTVTMAIASAQLANSKPAEFFNCDSFPPVDIPVFTPEWLVYLLREKKKPPTEVMFAWHEQQAVWEKETAEQKRKEEEAVIHSASQKGEKRRKKGKLLDELDDEGSDNENVGNQETHRAPAVHLDTEKTRRDEELLEAKKRKLVEERRPIFFKNNPGFQPIADTGVPGSKRVKGESFICQHSSVTQMDFNAHLTGPLEELMEFLLVERDVWRAYMYKKVISSLKAMRCRVSSVKDLEDLQWSKGRLHDKLVEILEPGRLCKLEAKKYNPRLRGLVELSRIWGVGPATAAKLYRSGFKSLDDLRTTKGASALNAQQQIGLKHYQDFLTKIPRAEVRQIEQIVVDEVHKMIPNATAFACGSYRRGKLTSGDCDVLITDPDEDQCHILPDLLKRLHASGFLTDDLIHISKQHAEKCDTYMGVCQVNEGLPHRRIDIKVYPRRFFGLATLYFTGSDHFNRSMRLFAHHNGWILSDRELKPVMRANGLKVPQGESVVCESEVDVFLALGLEYKDPTERNCFDIRFVDEDEASTKRGEQADVDVSDSE